MFSIALVVVLLRWPADPGTPPAQLTHLSSPLVAVVHVTFDSAEVEGALQDSQMFLCTPICARQGFQLHCSASLGGAHRASVRKPEPARCKAHADRLLIPPLVLAGLAGLALTSTLNLTQLMNWLVRRLTELEMNMNSVERILDYAEVPREIDTTKPTVRCLALNIQSIGS